MQEVLNKYLLNEWVYSNFFNDIKSKKKTLVSNSYYGKSLKVKSLTQSLTTAFFSPSTLIHISYLKIMPL